MEDLGARRSTWFRIGTVVVDSVVVRICRGSVGPIWRRETVTQGTAENGWFDPSCCHFLIFEFLRLLGEVVQ